MRVALVVTTVMLMIVILKRPAASADDRPAPQLGLIEQVSRASPSGTIVAFAGRKVPNGWLLCDGRPLKRNDFPDLFSVIGNTFNESPSSDSFSLPDLRGRFPLGAGEGGVWANADDPTKKVALSARKLGEAGGEEKHQMTIDQMPTHTHRSNFWLDSFGGEGEEVDQGIGIEIRHPHASGPQAKPTNALVGPAGSNKTFNIVPPFTVINYIIKQ